MLASVRFRLTAALIVLAAAALSAGCSSSEQETAYKSMSAAQSAGAVHSGWIPAWLPLHAYNLKERHAPDMSRSIVRFSFPAEERWAPPSDCSPVPPSQVAAPAVAAAWWPDDVVTRGVADPGHTYFACATPTAFLAVNQSRGEGFYWRVGR
jgi:hypothetical protein